MKRQLPAAQMKMRTLRNVSKMIGRADDTMAKAQKRYKRYFDRSVQTIMSIRPGQMVYVDRVPDSALTETEITANALG